MSSGSCTDPNRQGTNHTITFGLDGNGAITVSDPDLVGVCVNDTITFTCPDYPWAVQFVGLGKPKSSERKDPPLDRLAVSGAAGASGSVQVQTKASTGKQWDYVVSIYADGRIVTLDPDIVIGSRGG